MVTVVFAEAAYDESSRRFKTTADAERTRKTTYFARKNHTIARFGRS